MAQLGYYSSKQDFLSRASESLAENELGMYGFKVGDLVELTQTSLHADTEHTEGGPFYFKAGEQFRILCFCAKVRAKKGDRQYFVNIVRFCPETGREQRVRICTKFLKKVEIAPFWPVFVEFRQRFFFTTSGIDEFLDAILATGIQLKTPKNSEFLPNSANYWLESIDSTALWLKNTFPDELETAISEPEITAITRLKDQEP